jgi:hypothetical protein
MSKIEVNAVEPQSGTTLTLGASGDTVALAAGALQTGFGRTGTVDWSSTIQTTGFTAVSGVGYFCDTSSASFTVTLPANPSVGDIVAIKDWSSTAATNNIIIGRNGQEIEGNADNGAINVHGDAQTLVFSGASRGWMVVNSGLLEGIQGAKFVSATGGTVLTCGNYKVHVFTGPGSFVVSCGGNDIGSNSVEYMVVSGGGGGSFGGGGAGGFRQNYPSPTIAGLPVTATTYPITVGAGGAGKPSICQGSNSVFSTITSTGGGRGGGPSSAPPGNPNNGPGGDGGSGGGGGHNTSGGGSGDPGGAGNTPPVSPSQGNAGGSGYQSGSYYGGGGGGGASAVGNNAGAGPTTTATGGSGGNGNYWPNPVFGPTAPSYGTSGPVPGVRYFAGGGGGAYTGCNPAYGAGGAGGGGKGGSDSGSSVPATPGTANTGGGGGGANSDGRAGGSGIVVIRYKYQ